MPGLTLGARTGGVIALGGKSYLSLDAAEYAATQIFELTDEGVVPGPRLTGSLGDVYTFGPR